MNNGGHHSTDNGFACAAAGRGITEALQEHLNVIVRNEELEIEASNAHIQAEISDLAADIDRLEQQKIDRQRSINEMTELLAEKNVKSAELNAELEGSINGNMPQLQDDRIEDLKNRIDEKTSELEEKRVECAAIETDLENPTEVELNRAHVSGEAQASSKQQFSWLHFTFAIFTTLMLVGLIIYIFYFYASVADKAFKAAKGTDVINYEALSTAWEKMDGFVLLLPVVFVFFAIVSYFYWERDKRVFLGAVVITLLFDVLIAWRIAVSIDLYIYEKGLDQTSPAIWWLNLGGIIFLGFVVSLLLSFGFHCFIELWKRVKPSRDEANQVEKQIRTEKNDRLVRLNALTTEVQHLEDNIGALNREKQDYENQNKETAKQQLDAHIADHKRPIEVEIARLNAEKENQQSQIDELNEQVESLQKEINQCESEIKALSDQASKQIINVKKLEAQTYEFVSGWCRYVAQSKTELPDDISTQIRHIQNLRDETLEKFKVSLSEI